MPQVRVGWRSGAVSPVVSVSKLLDMHGSSAAAYSLRKLSSAYAGSAIRVRRSSDNTEQNIGFDSDGNLDTYALSTFVGTGNGFVTTWYDQSGNDRNATQATAANQPSIVSSGIVINLNNKSSIYFNGSTFMSTTQNVVSAGSGGYSVFGLGRPGGSPNCLFYIGIPSSNNGIGLNNNNGTPRHYWFGNDYDSGQTFANTNSIFVASYDGVKRYTTINNVTTSANSSGKNTISPTLTIGKLANWGQNLVGYESELVIYDSNKESIRTDITNDINSYYSVYPNPTSVWNLLAAAYNADTIASSSLKTSLYAVYNGESNANDSFGTKNGTAVGGVTYSTGKIGNAFTLNGTNAYVSIPRTANEFDFTGDFSINVWIKPTANSATNKILQNFYGTSTTNRYGYNLYLQSGLVRFATYKGNTGALSASIIAQAPTTIVGGTWYHIVITKATSNAFKIYINGVLQTLTVIEGDLSFTPVYSSSNQVNIGSGFNNGVRSEYFNGQIDALNIWTKELTASEVSELYNSGNGAQYITTDFYKPTANDALGTYNGTAQGGLTYGLGKVGTAFQFNGTNAHVQLGDVMDIGLSSWSYAFWLKANVLNPSTYQTVFSKSRSAGVTGRIWCTMYGNNLQFNFHSGLNNGGDVIHTQSVLSFNINTWYHIVCVLDRNDKLKMYINGSLATTNVVLADQATLASNNLIPYLNVNYDTNIPFRIGSYTAADNATPSGFFNGSIDGFSVWSRVLTASEISELYNSGNGKQYPN